LRKGTLFKFVVDLSAIGNWQDKRRELNAIEILNHNPPILKKVYLLHLTIFSFSHN
jgi:hypothetical protein